MMNFSIFFVSAYPAYLLNPYHVNYQLKMLTSNQLQLHDILYNDSSLSYFIEVGRRIYRL
jgi:hypothetical protein